MTKSSKKTVRYSTCFKMQVIESIEKDGLNIEECRRKYGIAGNCTIQKWLKKYGKGHLLNKVVRVETIEERDELKRLKEENKALKLAYAELALHHKCSEKCLEVADEMFGLDLKKKYEQELSVYSKGKKL
jgi:Transposase and inactivated derivatives